ncbi:MAG: alanine racemase [Bacteroidia bacterium]
MFHTSVIEISKSALVNNLKFLSAQLGHTKISSVVKGNAYGHGIEHFVPIAEECGINHFSVFSADEAWRVIKCAHNYPDILIMGMLDDQQIGWAIENNIEFYVFDQERLQRAAIAAKKQGKKAKVHIELETGMNRTGFAFNQLGNTLDYIRANSAYLDFSGFCTHFAGAESIANYFRIKNQIKAFKKGIHQLKKQDALPNIYHAACSAAAFRFKETRLQMARIGIMQYGFWPSREVFIEYNSKIENKVDPLQRIITWKSRVMSIKSVKAGEFIGYGTSYLAQSDMTIAIVPVGYSHGFARSLSNSGRAIIRGNRVGVVGTINMNALTVDITGFEGIERGDEVVLIGDQADVSVSVSSFSELSEQLNYELLVRLPSDIPRKIVD